MPKIKILKSTDKIRDLTTDEIRAGENVFSQCLNVKHKEGILIVTDILKEKIEAAIFFETAKKFTNKLSMVVFSPTGQHGIEPPKEVARIMLKADVILAPTTYSLTHTQTREAACKKGARIASMPGISRETILRTLTINYDEVADLSKKIAGLLTMAKIAHLTSENGTDLLIPLEGRDAIVDTGLIHNPGDFGNLPAGEAFIAPVESKASGIVIFDAGFTDEAFDQPIGLDVKDGMAINISDGMVAAKFKKILQKIGPDAFNLAELGIGTNKVAKLGKGILELEKVYGTVHLALGSNIHFGGEVDVPYHEDGVILKPTLKLDDKIILKEGKFLT